MSYELGVKFKMKKPVTNVTGFFELIVKFSLYIK
jgi:hypothetical protein